MAAYEFAPGTTGVTVHVYIRDSNTGQGKINLTATSPGAAVAYTRKGGIPAAFTLTALADSQAAWQAGGFVALGGLAPGEYRLDLPDAVAAAGAPFSTVNIAFSGAFGEGVLVLLRNPVNNVGAGAVTVPVTIQRPDLTPISGAEAWVTTDVGGTNTIAGTLTSTASGVVTFLLDPGTYFLWVKGDGYQGNFPEQITVS
jgi:hypothetical protein